MQAVPPPFKCLQCNHHPTAANTFAVKESSFPLWSVNINTSGGELRHINCRSSSSRRTAWHSLPKELNLALLSELTLRRRKLYDHIQNNESTLSKLEKKYKGKKLKKLYDVNSDPLMDDLSSFSLEAARFLESTFRKSRQRPKGRRWNFDDKVLALLKRSPRSYILHKLLPLPSRRSLQSIQNTLPFRTGISAHGFVHSNSLCRKSLVEITTVVSCFMKCQSERTYISTRSLIALRVLRIVEVRAGHRT
jgi:hypothetical protein